MKAADWVIEHSKNICYLLIGIDCFWAIPYCIYHSKDIPSGVLSLVGIVYGVGMIRSVGAAHADGTVKAAKLLHPGKIKTGE